MLPTKEYNYRYCWVYIMMNKGNSTLYVGVTNDLQRRVTEHKLKVNDGFSKKYNVGKIVYYESFYGPCLANRREKQLKRWHREWKLNLIKKVNPELRDLLDDIRKEVIVL
ncbi:GIY-YIG nuclease family protein [Candidatus Uhrbacteria bacterium]|nr:GIY-YIG nuclease family protein [Candidatus Uhrbacteria bacterium]